MCEKTVREVSSVPCTHHVHDLIFELINGVHVVPYFWTFQNLVSRQRDLHTRGRSCGAENIRIPAIL